MKVIDLSFLRPKIFLEFLNRLTIVSPNLLLFFTFTYRHLLFESGRDSLIAFYAYYCWLFCLQLQLLYLGFYFLSDQVFCQQKLFIFLDFLYGVLECLIAVFEEFNKGLISLKHKLAGCLVILCKLASFTHKGLF